MLLNLFLFVIGTDPELAPDFVFPIAINVVTFALVAVAIPDSCARAQTPNNVSPL